jgi:hypothetical protein
MPDNWMTYCCPECCGPVGGCGPIQYELFVRTGPALKVNGGFPFAALTDGWMVEAGGRSLFIDADPVRAWTVELAGNYIYNGGDHSNFSFPFPTSAQLPATTPVGIVRVVAADLHRNYLKAGFGREWWLIGTACSCDHWHWRAGTDVGFRYGVARLDVHDFTQIPLAGEGQFNRATSITYGPYVSVHSDVEYPWGCCAFIAGVRAEWDYSRMNVFSARNNDLYDVNLLLNLGVRY